MTATLEVARMVVGDERPVAAGRAFHTAVDPATGVPVAEVPLASAVDVDHAVRTARAAFDGEWSRVGPADRQRLIQRVADLVRTHSDELAALDSRDMGMPITRTRRLAMASAAFLDWYAAAARTLRGHTIENSRPNEMLSYTVRQPVGVVGAITPWNTPLPMMTWKLGPVLASGSTLVLKPAEVASRSALRLAELCLEAGIPPGVVNVVTGDGAAGAALVEHPHVDKVAFTGSVATGQAIIRASAGTVKRLTLELGGKSPNIVFEDADLGRAAAAAALSIFGNSGQVCVAGSRLLVQRTVYEEFLARVAEIARHIVVGDPFDDATEMGPVASSAQLDRVLGYIEAGHDDGARLVSGGRRIAGPNLARGFFVEPTIFADVADDMRVAREEIFGPVLAATPFEDVDDAVASANSTPYGLAAYVWTEDLRTAHDVSTRVRAGTVSINSVGNLDPAVPMGGLGISGYGKELGVEQLEEYLDTKTIWLAR